MAAMRHAAAGVILLLAGGGGGGEDAGGEQENSFSQPKSKCPVLCSDWTNLAGT